MPPRAKPAGAAPTAVAARRPAARHLTPEYVEALKAYARILFDGGLCPKGVTRPEAVAALIEVGRDVGLSATQSVANIAIVNGRPSIFGDAALALVRASGLLESIAESVEGDGDEFAAVCVTRRVGVGDQKTTRFSVADAKRAGLWAKKGPWQEYPERMLQFRARGWNLRDNFGDVLMGLIFTEEAHDIDPGPRVVVSQSGFPVLPASRTGDPAPVVPLADQKAGDKPAGVSAGVSPLVACDILPLPTDDEEPTDEQLARLSDLRDSLLTAHGATDDEERAKTIWLAHLEPYGVKSALHLTRDQANELISDLATDHDPFDKPPAATPATN